MKRLAFFGAALTIAAGTLSFTSCSNHEVEQWSQEDMTRAKYEQAFIKRFGQPAKDQTWGFGTVTKVGVRSVKPNSNEWAKTWVVPGALSEAERTYVMNWFKTHGKNDGTTFDFNDYFVQNVGYSDNSYSVTNSNGNTTSISSKGHMDQLFANLSDGSTDHIYNFNTGSGDIMLMVNSETKYGFGYNESFGTDDNTVKGNYLLAVIDVPNVGVGYYVGLDYQAKKSGEGIDLQADGVYDDRVLKIVPAQIKADVRVIAEDLSVDEKSDFDFNDVVFDVKFGYPSWDKTTIILQAAGGTLPLYIAGKEVHGLFGVSETTMVNTGSGVSKAPVTFELDGTFGKDANNIEVTVKKDGAVMTITAERGRVASKIAVGSTYEWCSERQDIEAKYPAFGKYVKNEVGDDWWQIK